MQIHRKLSSVLALALIVSLSHCSGATALPNAQRVAFEHVDAAGESSSDDRTPSPEQECEWNERHCNARCADIRRDVEHCGACEISCPTLAHAQVQCVEGVCAVTCEPGLRMMQGRCVEEVRYPRPIAPLSLGDVTLLRPTLRWKLTAEFDGAVVDICRDRGCQDRIETLRVHATSVRPTRNLAARSTVYWRLRGLRGEDEGVMYSPTWLFHVPAQGAIAGVDTSRTPHLDLNGDGFDDVVVGSPRAGLVGRIHDGAVAIYYGGVDGPPATPSLVIPGDGISRPFGHVVGSAGDVNGDGFGDLFVASSYRSNALTGGDHAVSIFHGSATGVSSGATTRMRQSESRDHFGAAVATAGDVNLDGFADLLISGDGADPDPSLGQVQLYLGGFDGLGLIAAKVYEVRSPDAAADFAFAGGMDLNGDGASDFLIMVISSDLLPRIFASRTLVFYGAAGSLPTAPAADFAPFSDARVSYVNVNTAGDINFDGYSDIIISRCGTPERASAGPSRAYVFVGTSGGISADATDVIYDADSTRCAQWQSQAAGDVNGDGFGDVLVVRTEPTVPNMQQASSVVFFHGGPQGLEPSPASILRSADPTARFAHAIAAAGDVNDDGFADIVVGSPYGIWHLFSDAGRAELYLGGVGGISEVAARLWFGFSRGDLFGGSVASASTSLTHSPHPTRGRLNQIVQNASVLF